ncbi:ParB N-terminal domain-containing protein [Myxococcus stipitatus]|uniref:ParB N-terminal domain-containing protein n=1 Tax=Myxococcus stipitatus TaxID=83455 RepID=UPI001F270141|nr:ParB N-terminal domain-containing protein [Myxococcus stipitatus]MCE9672719.1 ParB N-terminal domain-containing protein [Myxococcus stipitatus]
MPGSPDGGSSSTSEQVSARGGEGAPEGGVSAEARPSSEESRAGEGESSAQATPTPEVTTSLEQAGAEAAVSGAASVEEPRSEAPEPPVAPVTPAEPEPAHVAGNGVSGTADGAQVASASDGGDGDSEEFEPLEAPEERLAGRVVTVLMPLERLEDDVSFRLRPEGDVSGLATDIARLGQLFPVDVRPLGGERFQLVCGFRRVAALRFLKRDAVQARVHTDLSDEDALLMSLAEAIHATPVEPEVLEAKREQLEAQGRLSAAVADMLEKALATEESLAPEGVEEEIDADELAADVSQRLGAINQDLSLLADVFASLDESRRAELLMQLRYSSELVAYLEGL